MRKRTLKENAWRTRPAGNSFSAGRPRKCGENVVATASVAEIYYSVTLQAHSKEREKEKRSLHGDTLALLFAGAFHYA